MAPLCRPRRADASAPAALGLALALALALAGCAATAAGGGDEADLPDAAAAALDLATARVPPGDADDDHDDYAVAAGDCDDRDPLVNPGAMEVWGNRVDDDCDGHTDELPPPCDAADPMMAPSPEAMAGAVELCAPWVLGSRVNAGSDPRARAVLHDFGVYRPRAGRSFVALSTGIAADAGDPGFVLPQPGTELGGDAPNPLPMPNVNGCGAGADEPIVHDYVEWTLELRVPKNARSLHFDFMFVTAEYPEFVCSQFNDKFLALLASKSYQGNVSFDAKGHPVTVNVGFFDVCASTPANTCGRPIAKLAGTGYERFDYMDRPIGGGTDWLRTTAPVTPGETIELRFILFDEGDRRFDSTVILDEIQFELDAAAAPVTIG